MTVNGSALGLVTPGVPATLRFEFAAKLFDIVHEKPFHLIIASADGELFAHVHPELQRDGSFLLRLNEATNDPDNQDLARAVPKSGEYLLLGEIKPKGQPLQQVRFGLTAAGTPVPFALVADAPLPDTSNLYRKFISADGMPGNYGDAYRVTLATDRVTQGGMDMRHLRVCVEQAVYAGESVAYEKVTNLEDWLGMQGHAVLISAQGALQERTFMHLHAGSHAAHGPSASAAHQAAPKTAPEAVASAPLTFMLPGEPKAGLYKTVVQFKHGDRVVTAPFALSLGGWGP
jgi:hypothetical protein